MNLPGRRIASFSAYTLPYSNRDPMRTNAEVKGTLCVRGVKFSAVLTCQGTKPNS